MRGDIATEFPYLTAGNFEHCLASDDTLVHYFNDFLSLPCFPEALLYKQETGVFEVVSEAAECVSRMITSVLHRSKSQLLTDGPTVLARGPPIDNHYTVCCLDKEQGFQWIMKERFPLFTQSDCYFEYRLAKLLSQWDPKHFIQKGDTSFQNTLAVTRHLSSPQMNNENVPKAPTGLQEKASTKKQESMRMYNLTLLPSSGQEGHREIINQTRSASSRCFSCSPGPEEPCTLSSSSSSSSSCSNVNSVKTGVSPSPQTELTLCSTEPSTGTTAEQCLSESNTKNFESSDHTLTRLAAKLVRQVIKDAVILMEGCRQTNTSDHLSWPGGKRTSCALANGSFESEVCHCSTRECRKRLVEEKERVEEREKTGEKTHGVEEKNEEVGSVGTDEKNVLDICYHGARFHGSTQGLEEFKQFLRGTQGEKLLHLWMDIERLKTTQHWERKNRHVVLMRSRYLLSGGQSNLSVELLSRLGLTTTPCWTEEKLHLVQPCLTEALLFYWAPRFWTSQCIQEDSIESAHLGLWTERHLRPPSGIDPQPRCITQLPLRPESCLPRSHNTAQTQSCSRSSSSSPVLGSRRMERMLQALYVDSRAGLYFTHFCEHAGNQLWENAVHFWADLQHYRHLFYQDGLDPYGVQRQAQFLYATYLCSSARRSIGVYEETRREVYNRLTPAFEEVFDEVEEHTLAVLLEPWTLLITRDTESYQRVCVWKELRQVDSEDYWELQGLYEESELRLKQVEQCEPTPPLTPPHPDSPRGPDPWIKVAPRYRRYRLGSLLGRRHEIQHFLSFLQDHDASTHLSCWLDLEQYRRTPQKDKAARQQRSADITTKYLNRKYFFGPGSPASTEQQKDIMHLAGGLDRLKHECLSSPVVVEIQSIVRSHIEKTWLPLFLATAEFTERQKHKLRSADRLSEQFYRRQRKRREAWKTEGLWMSSSKEILVFRRVLLNPVTCQQFQHFVSLKGDFLENDVLFWLEVQRYKDLCHSHSDEATIQKKISTIISCFINSSIPPALQIDIPPQQAQRILDKRKELGPYIFREAQMSVFSELLKLWPEFQALRSRVQEEQQLLPLLKEKRVKQRARQQRRRRKEEEEEEEERRAQEELEGQECSFTEEDEDQVDGGRESREKVEQLTRSTVFYSPTQQMSWSYSKYMMALKREEVLLRRQSQLDAVASFSTASDSSSGHSLKSGGSRRSPPSSLPQQRTGH